MNERKKTAAASPITLFCLLVGILLLLVVLGNLNSLLTTDAPLQTVAELSAEDFVENGSYDFGEVTILDSYACTTGEEETDIRAYYVILAFSGKDSTPMTISMSVPAGSALFDEVEDYLEDDTALMGDYSASICGVAGAFTNTEIQGFYEEYVQQLTDDGVEFTALPLNITYKGADAQEFEETTAKDRQTDIIVCVVMVAAGIALLAVGILRTVKQKKARAEPQGPELP